jgi:cyclase
MSSLRPRVIPCLQLDHRDLVKTHRFKSPQYLGDPINAVKIFNDLECDELIVVDIGATRENRQPDFEFIQDFASEAFMPLAYGGGITNVDQIRRLFLGGVEKVVINSAANGTNLISSAAALFGSQSIVVSMDVRTSLLGRKEVWTRSATLNTRISPLEYAIAMERLGAGELFVQSVELEGAGTGYDMELMVNISRAVRIPVIACGGAGSTVHVRDLIAAGVAAAAAGTMFSLHGRHRAPLISYLKPQEIEALLPSGQT